MRKAFCDFCGEEVSEERAVDKPNPATRGLIVQEDLIFDGYPVRVQVQVVPDDEHHLMCPPCARRATLLALPPPPYDDGDALVDALIAIGVDEGDLEATGGERAAAIVRRAIEARKRERSS